MRLFSTPVTSIIDLRGDPSFYNRFWRNWIGLESRKVWIVPHAARRLSTKNSDSITVYTSPCFPVWLAALVRSRLQYEHWATPDFLLTAGHLWKTTPDTLDAVQRERFFLLDMGMKARTREASVRWISDLLELSAVTNRTIHFVPLIYLWNRSPARRFYHPVYGFLRHNRNNLFSTGYPITIQPGVTFQIPTAGTIRREMIAAWNQETRVIIGDKTVPIRKTINTIQSEPTLVKLLDTLSSQGKDSLPTLQSRVAAYVREIAAAYSYLSPWLWEFVLGSFFRNNFSSLDFDQDGLDELRILLRKRSKVILIPTHRSHLDYIFISYAIYKQGLACPLVAAGQNLSFWPMGYFFRKTGAFFIRRTFQGLDIYPHVFRSYLWLIMQKFQPVEFFIEGGRSRTGSMLPAKLGLLNMILEAYNSGKLSDVNIVPLTVNYDRIMEEESYTRELKGLPKQKETVNSLIKSRHLLKRHYGKVCFAVGKPLSLAGMLQDCLPTEQKERVGSTIMNALRLTMPVTSTSLVATVMMSLDEKTGLCSADLTSKALDLLNLIREVHPESIIAAEFTAPDQTAASVIETAIERMFQFGNVWHDAVRDEWRLNQDRRLQVDYLKNSIFGLLLGPALAVHSMQRKKGGWPWGAKLHTLFCPDIHPIPPEIVLSEMKRSHKMMDSWSPPARDTLKGLLKPSVNLIGCLFELISDDVSRIREMTSSAWRVLFQKAISQSKSDPFTELTSTAMETLAFKSIKHYFGQTGNDRDL